GAIREPHAAISALQMLSIATLLSVESRPVFADLSGRRRRLMRRLGIGSGAGLVMCLAAVVVALAGGPEAPLTHWAAPHRPAVDTAGPSPTGQHRHRSGAAASTAPSSQPGLV